LPTTADEATSAAASRKEYFWKPRGSSADKIEDIYLEEVLVATSRSPYPHQQISVTLSGTQASKRGFRHRAVAEEWLTAALERADRFVAERKDQAGLAYERAVRIRELGGTWEEACSIAARVFEVRHEDVQNSDITDYARYEHYRPFWVRLNDLRERRAAAAIEAAQPGPGAPMRVPRAQAPGRFEAPSSVMGRWRVGLERSPHAAPAAAAVPSRARVAARA
jgi:hypothetical protein